MIFITNDAEIENDSDVLKGSNKRDHNGAIVRK